MIKNTIIGAATLYLLRDGHVAFLPSLHTRNGLEMRRSQYGNWERAAYVLSSHGGLFQVDWDVDDFNTLMEGKKTVEQAHDALLLPWEDDEASM